MALSYFSNVNYSILDQNSFTITWNFYLAPGESINVGISRSKLDVKDTNNNNYYTDVNNNISALPTDGTITIVQILDPSGQNYSIMPGTIYNLYLSIYVLVGNSQYEITSPVLSIRTDPYFINVQAQPYSTSIDLSWQVVIPNGINSFFPPAISISETFNADEVGSTIVPIFYMNGNTTASLLSIGTTSFTITGTSDGSSLLPSTTYPIYLHLYYDYNPDVNHDITGKLDYALSVTTSANTSHPQPTPRMDILCTNYGTPISVITPAPYSYQTFAIGNDNYAYYTSNNLLAKSSLSNPSVITPVPMPAGLNVCYFVTRDIATGIIYAADAVGNVWQAGQVSTTFSYSSNYPFLMSYFQGISPTFISFAVYDGYIYALYNSTTTGYVVADLTNLNILYTVSTTTAYYILATGINQLYITDNQGAITYYNNGLTSSITNHGDYMNITDQGVPFFINSNQLINQNGIVFVTMPSINLPRTSPNYTTVSTKLIWAVMDPNGPGDIYCNVDETYTYNSQLYSRTSIYKIPCVPSGPSTGPIYPGLYQTGPKTLVLVPFDCQGLSSNIASVNGSGNDSYTANLDTSTQPPSYTFNSLVPGTTYQVADENITYATQFPMLSGPVYPSVSIIDSSHIGVVVPTQDQSSTLSVLNNSYGVTNNTGTMTVLSGLSPGLYSVASSLGYQYWNMISGSTLCWQNLQPSPYMRQPRQGNLMMLIIILIILYFIMKRM